MNCNENDVHTDFQTALIDVQTDFNRRFLYFSATGTLEERQPATSRRERCTHQSYFQIVQMKWKYFFSISSSLLNICKFLAPIFQPQKQNPLYFYSFFTFRLSICLYLTSIHPSHLLLYLFSFSSCSNPPFSSNFKKCQEDANSFIYQLVLLLIIIILLLS